MNIINFLELDENLLFNNSKIIYENKKLLQEEIEALNALENYVKCQPSLNDISNSNNNGIVKMIESSFDGHLRIWDFHLGILLEKIKICCNDWLFGICLWDDDYLFVGCGDKTIKLVELKSRLVTNHLSGSKNKVLTIKSLEHPNYGKCLISYEIKHFPCLTCTLKMPDYYHISLYSLHHLNEGNQRMSGNESVDLFPLFLTSCWDHQNGCGA